MELLFNYFLVLDVLVLFGLVVSLLTGLIRGFRKSLRRFVAILIPTILLFIFITPITNAIMKVEVNLAKIDSIIEVIPDELTTETYSIDKAISYVVGSYVYPDDLDLQANSEVQQLALSASSMVVKIVVYFVGLFFIGICSLIIRLILRIIFGKAKRTKRLAGMGVGFARFVLNFILYLLPLFGTLSLASSVINVAADYIEEEEIKEVIELTDLYEETITKKFVLKPLTYVFCTNKSLSCDGQYVAGALSFKLNGKKVSLNKEYLEIKEALPTVNKLINVVSEFEEDEEPIIKLSEFSDDDIENISSIIRNSNLIRVAIPAGLEYAVYSMNEEDTDYIEIINQLKLLDWDHELNAIADLINVLKKHNNLEINISNFEYLLQSNGVIDLASDLVTGALQIDIVTEIAIPIGINLLEQEFTTGDFEEFGIDFTKIKEINWKTDGAPFISTIITIYKEYLKIDINFTDLTEALNDDELPSFVLTVFDELKKSNIVTDTILPVAIQVLIANLESNDDLTSLGIDFTELKNVNWKNNLDPIKILLHDLVISYQTLEINPDEFILVLKNNKLQNELSGAVDNILNCEVFADYILPIAMNALITNLESNEDLATFEFDFEAIRNTNWKNELAAFKDVFVEFLNAYQGLDYNKEDWTLILDNKELPTYVKNIYNKIKKSTLVSNHILPKLPNKIHELLDNIESSIDISFLKEIITEETIDTLFNTDVNKLVNLLKEINGLGLFDGAELDFTDPVQQDSLINIINKIFTLSVIDGKEKDLFKSIMNLVNIEEMLTEYNITLDYENVSDWDKEVNNICSLFKNILLLTGSAEGFDFSSFFNESLTIEQKEAISNVVESIGNSELFGDSIYTMLESIISEIDESCTLTLTNEDKNLIENVNGWKYETMHILNLIEKVQDVNFESSYDSLDADLIKEIMLYASESVICTKALGTVLNTVFSGVVQSDFTDQAVMKNSADVVYNAIKVSTIITDDNLDLNDSTVTSELITSIENIATNEENIELTNQLLNDIIGNETPVEYTKEDITDAAEVVESIIEIYQNSTDQDNFSLEDLSEEDKEKIENSDIAKAILDTIFSFLQG